MANRNTSECHAGYSNFDELDLVDISDCHINEQTVKIMHTINVGLCCVLVAVCAFKIFPLVKLGIFFYRDYVPHLCVTTWCLSGITTCVYSLHKLVAQRFYLHFDTLGLLLQSIVFTWLFCGGFMFAFYLMNISIFAEIGQRGIALIKEFWGNVKVLCSMCLLCTTAPHLITLIDNTRSRQMSYAYVFGLACAEFILCSTTAYYCVKANGLLALAIKNHEIEMVDDSNLDLQHHHNRMEMVRRLKAKRRIFQLVSYMLMGGSTPSVLTVTLSPLFVPLLAKNMWLLLGCLYLLGSLVGTLIVCVVNVTPPQNARLDQVSPGVMFVPTSTPRKTSTLRVISRGSSSRGGGVKLRGSGIQAEPPG